MKTPDYEHLTPSQNCPVCGHPVDRSGGDADRPQEGDITICLQCNCVLMLGPGLLLVKADLESLDVATLWEIFHIQMLISRGKISSCLKVD